MRRPPIAALLCTLPAALSCAVLSAPAPRSAPAADVPEPVAVRVEEAEPLFAVDPTRVKQVHRFLAAVRAADARHAIVQDGQAAQATSR